MYKINSNIKPLKELPVSGIYQIRNLVNNKIYIGSAENFDKRKREHFNRLRKGTHANIHLQNAYNKYGENFFIFSIINYVENKSLLLKYEQYFLDYFKMNDPDCLYNICLIAGSTFNKKHTKETIEKMSLSRKRNLGIIPNDETREKMSIAQKKSWARKSVKEKMSETMRGNINNGSKLNVEKVLEIKKLLADGMKQIDIAKIFEVSKNLISHVKTGRIWKYVK